MIYLLLYLVVGFICFIEVVREYTERRGRLPGKRLGRTALMIGLFWAAFLVYFVCLGACTLFNRKPSR